MKWRNDKEFIAACLHLIIFVLVVLVFYLAIREITDRHEALIEAQAETIECQEQEIAELRSQLAEAAR